MNDNNNGFSVLEEDDNTSPFYSNNPTNDWGFDTSTPAGNRTEDKYSHLSGARRKKMERLAGLSPTDLTDEYVTVDGYREHLGNKVMNDYSLEDLSYLEDQLYAEEGVELTENGLFRRDPAGNRVPYEGDPNELSSFYRFATRDGNVKIGIWGGLMPEGRYSQEYLDSLSDEERDEFYGALGVDPEQLLDNKLLPRQTATLLEGLWNGNRSYMEQRAVRLPAGGDVEAYQTVRDLYGSGATEIYKPVNIEVDPNVDRTELWDSFNDRFRPTTTDEAGVPTASTGPMTDEERAEYYDRMYREYYPGKFKKGFMGRMFNTVSGAIATFALETIVNPADAALETVGLGLGTEEQKNNFIYGMLGYDETFVNDAMERIGENVENVYNAVAKGEDFDAEDVAAILSEITLTPELLGTSLGGTLGLFLGLGKFTRLGGAVSKVEKRYRAGKITKEKAKADVQRLRSAATAMQRSQELVGKNAGYIAIVAGGANNRIDAFRENNEGELDVTDVSRIILLESAMAGLDRFSGRQVLKAVPGVSHIFGNADKKALEAAAAALPPSMYKEFRNKALGILKDAGVSSMTEAGTEYLQTLLEITSTQWMSERYGDDIAAILTSDDSQIEALTGAAVGFGTGGQMSVGGAAVGAAARGLTGRARPVQLPAIPAEDTSRLDVSEEQAAVDFNDFGTAFENLETTLDDPGADTTSLSELLDSLEVLERTSYTAQYLDTDVAARVDSRIREAERKVLELIRREDNEELTLQASRRMLAIRAQRAEQEGAATTTEAEGEVSEPDVVSENENPSADTEKVEEMSRRLPLRVERAVATLFDNDLNMAEKINNAKKIIEAFSEAADLGVTTLSELDHALLNAHDFLEKNAPEELESVTAAGQTDGAVQQEATEATSAPVVDSALSEEEKRALVETVTRAAIREAAEREEGSTELSEADIKALHTFAESQGVRKEAVDSYVRTWASVEQEATTEYRGVDERRDRLRNLLLADDVDEEAIRTQFGEAERFLAATTQSIENLKDGIKEARRLAATLNNSRNPFKGETTRKIQTEYIKADGTPFIIEVVYNPNSAGRPWAVHAGQANERIKRKTATKNNLERLVSEFVSDAGNYLGEEVLSARNTLTIGNRTDTTKNPEASFVENVKKAIGGQPITKVILGSNRSEWWGPKSLNHRMNSTIVNVEEKSEDGGAYNEGDVVYLHARNNQKKGTVSKSSKKKGSPTHEVTYANTNLSKELTAATDAGATIVLSNTNGPDSAIKKKLDKLGYIPLGVEGVETSIYVKATPAAELRLAKKKEEQKAAKAEKSREKKLKDDLIAAVVRREAMIAQDNEADTTEIDAKIKGLREKVTKYFTAASIRAARRAAKEELKAAAALLRDKTIVVEGAKVLVEEEEGISFAEANDEQAAVALWEKFDTGNIPSMDTATAVLTSLGITDTVLKGLTEEQIVGVLTSGNEALAAARGLVKAEQKKFEEKKDKHEQQLFKWVNSAKNAKTTVEKLNAISKVKGRVRAAAEAGFELSQKAQKAIRDIEAVEEDLATNKGVTITEDKQAGKPFDESMSIVASSTVTSDKAPEGETIIGRVIKPELVRNGEVIQAAEVELWVGEKPKADKNKAKQEKRLGKALEALEDAEFERIAAKEVAAAEEGLEYDSDLVVLNPNDAVEDRINAFIFNKLEKLIESGKQHIEDGLASEEGLISFDNKDVEVLANKAIELDRLSSDMGSRVLKAWESATTRGLSGQELLGAINEAIADTGIKAVWKEEDAGSNDIVLGGQAQKMLKEASGTTNKVGTYTVQFRLITSDGKESIVNRTVFDVEGRFKPGEEYYETAAIAQARKEAKDRNDGSEANLPPKKPNKPKGVSVRSSEILSVTAKWNDPNKYLRVKGTTPFNTLPVEKMPSLFRRMAASTKKSFSKVIPALDKDAELDVRLHRDGKSRKNLFRPINSPARTLLFDKDGNISDNAALAMAVAIRGALKTNRSALKIGQKDKETVAKLFGLSFGDPTRAMHDIAQENGMLLKTLAHDLGKSFLKEMGITALTGADIHKDQYTNMVSDIGNVIVAIGEEQGIFKVKTEESNTLATHMKGGEVIEDSEATTAFVNLAHPENRKFELTEAVETAIQEADTIDSLFAGAGRDVRDVSYGAAIGQTQQRRAVSTVRHALADEKVPKGAVRTLKSGMNTEFGLLMDNTATFLGAVDADTERTGFFKALGFIPIDPNNPDYAALLQDEKEIQESKNEDILRSIEHIRKGYNLINEGEVSNSIFFPMYYMGNHRFGYDTNTINPQTDKFHRFLTVPKAHIVEYEVGEKNTFTYTYVKHGEEQSINASFLVRAALAQAFGYDIDKEASDDIIRVGNFLLSLSADEVASVKEEFLETGLVPLPKDGNISKGVPDHPTHTLQAIDFLERLVSREDGLVSSGLSLETDSLTSGFANKLQQFGLLDNLDEHAARVGVFRNTVGNEFAELMQDPTQGGNDSKAKSGLPDSYQNLAGTSIKGVKQRVTASELGLKNVAIFEGIAAALPGGSMIGKVNVEVDKALRSMFKFPFMTFNYAASINRIVDDLSRDVGHSLLADIAKADLSDTNTDVYKAAEELSKLVTRPKKGEKLTPLLLQKMLREKSLQDIYVTESRLDTDGNRKSKPGKLTLIDYIAQDLIAPTYGAAVKDTFNNTFEDYIEIQDATNDAFQLTYTVFNQHLNNKIKAHRKEGHMVVTKEDMQNFIKELKGSFPLIAGPLNKLFEENDDINTGIHIYGSADAVTDSVRYTEASPQTHIIGDTKTRTINPIVRKIVDAANAGAVIPFHAIDGAEMAYAIESFMDNVLDGVETVEGIAQQHEGDPDTKGSGVLMIHDAVIAPLPFAEFLAYGYNKGMYEVNKDYSILGEIQKMLKNVEKLVTEDPADNPLAIDPASLKAPESIRSISKEERKAAEVEGAAKLQALRNDQSVAYSKLKKAEETLEARKKAFEKGRATEHALEEVAAEVSELRDSYNELADLARAQERENKFLGSFTKVLSLINVKAEQVEQARSDMYPEGTVITNMPLSGNSNYVVGSDAGVDPNFASNFDGLYSDESPYVLPQRVRDTTKGFKNVGVVKNARKDDTHRAEVSTRVIGSAELVDSRHAYSKFVKENVSSEPFVQSDIVMVTTPSMVATKDAGKVMGTNIGIINDEAIRALRSGATLLFGELDGGELSDAGDRALFKAISEGYPVISETVELGRTSDDTGDIIRGKQYLQVTLNEELTTQGQTESSDTTTAEPTGTADSVFTKGQKASAATREDLETKTNDSVTKSMEGCTRSDGSSGVLFPK